MADGELTLKLDDYLIEKIDQGAKAAGVSPEEFAVQLLGQHLFDFDDYEWDEDPRKVEPDLEDEAGPTRSLEEVWPEFLAELDRRLASKE